jgi:hypothetical protein
MKVKLALPVMILAESSVPISSTQPCVKVHNERCIGPDFTDGLPSFNPDFSQRFLGSQGSRKLRDGTEESGFFLDGRLHGSGSRTMSKKRYKEKSESGFYRYGVLVSGERVFNNNTVQIGTFSDGYLQGYGVELNTLVDVNGRYEIVQTVSEKRLLGYGRQRIQDVGYFDRGSFVTDDKEGTRLKGYELSFKDALINGMLVVVVVSLVAVTGITLHSRLDSRETHASRPSSSDDVKESLKNVRDTVMTVYSSLHRDLLDNKVQEQIARANRFFRDLDDSRRDTSVLKLTQNLWMNSKHEIFQGSSESLGIVVGSKGLDKCVDIVGMEPILLESAVMYHRPNVPGSRIHLDSIDTVLRASLRTFDGGLDSCPTCRQDVEMMPLLTYLIQDGHSIFNRQNEQKVPGTSV